MKKTPWAVLRDRSGSSMLLVMAVMVLLIAVGGSVLAAASTAVGQVASQKEYQQLSVYTESINQSFLYSLQVDDPDSLGTQLVHALYQNKLSGNDAAPLPTGFDLAMTGQTLPGVTVKLTAYFTPDVRITPYAETIITTQLDENGEPSGEMVLSPRQPQNALIDATMEIVTELSCQDNSGKPRKITSAATYRLSGAYLQDDGSNASNMTFPDKADRGRWEMTAYEKLDSNYD